MHSISLTLQRAANIVDFIATQLLLAINTCYSIALHHLGKLL
jgi:hypothetical protein